MSRLLPDAIRGIRSRRGRLLLAATGTFAAALMIGTSLTVGYSLATGFDRASARADAPDVIARFRGVEVGELARRVRALPDLAASAYRLELTDVPIAANGTTVARGAPQVVLGGPRGYAIVDGHDLSGSADEVVVERGVARALHLRVGQQLQVADLGALTVVGISVSPDNVAYPLASAARIYLPPSVVSPDFRGEANVMLLWARDRRQLEPMLVQARALSYGLQDLRFVTRAGVRALIDDAAGIVIALLVSFSAVALGAAAIMLAAAAHVDVQRRLPAIGVERALGASRGRVVGRSVVEAAAAAIPAAAAGLAAGTLLTGAAAGSLLERLNEMPPGAALAGPLAIAFAGMVAIVVAGTAWPAWRAASRPPAEVLRGGDIERAPRTAAAGRGFFALGARLIAARRGRAVATVAVLGVSAGVALLMLALASTLDRLEQDPSLLGKRYALTVRAPASRTGEISRVRGVAAAAPRYSVQAIDSFDLGETMTLVGYPGRHTTFEAPPLASGRRAGGPREAEVGQGLADALGLGVGGTLAAQLPSGQELRFRVVGVDRILESDGRVAFVSSVPLARATPGVQPQIVVRLQPGADAGAVSRRIATLGPASGPASAPGTSGAPSARPTTAAVAPPRRSDFLTILAGVLRLVAGIDALICLYALTQALALTARERRGVIALLRALGSGRGAISGVFAGSAFALLVPALALGALLERELLGPLVSRLGASYVSLPIAARPGELALVAAVAAAIGVGAALRTGRRLVREPVLAGLREDL
ncbi:MAG: ABC transporter permease [Actinobacteria bacterium]|nr:ABC transporter permease [Actinomycetota bacterium]